MAFHPKSSERVRDCRLMRARNAASVIIRVTASANKIGFSGGTSKAFTPSSTDGNALSSGVVAASSLRADDRQAVRQRGHQRAVPQGRAFAIGQDGAIGRQEVGRYLIVRGEAGPLDALRQAQFVDELLNVLQVGAIGGVAGADLAADHQQPRRVTGVHQLGQGADQRFTAFIGIEKAEIAEQPVIRSGPPMRPARGPVVIGGRLTLDVAADGDGHEFGGQPGVDEPAPVGGIGQDAGVAAAGQRRHAAPAQRPGLGEEIGIAQIVEGGHDFQRTLRHVQA